MHPRLTLSQYIDSKTQLVEAIKRDPIVKHEYSVVKYCKIPVGVTEDTKEYISLKPKTKLVVTWKYKYNNKHEELHEMQRIPISISIVDKKLEQHYDLHQTDERLSKWIQTNARIISK